MDFCSSILSPEVECKSPSVDDYGVNNLICCQSSRLHSQGFISESFVRPPIDIVLKFCCPIDISKINFSTKVLSKQSTGFFIFTYHDLHSLELNDTPTSYRVAQIFTKQEDNVSIINAHYKQHKLYEITNSCHNFSTRWNGSTFTGFLRNINREALKNVLAIKIRILKNVSNSGCALNALSVIGQPGTLATVQQVEAIKLAYHLHCNNSNNNDKIVANNEDAPTVTEETEPADDYEHPVPEDFLDPLTCELMVTPLLLPSGQSVDATTLDRFSAAESLYNRPPSNPFTGVPFTPSLQPVPNVHLKARIDRFVTLKQRDPATSLLPTTAQDQLNHRPSSETRVTHLEEPRKIVNKGNHTNKTTNNKRKFNPFENATETANFASKFQAVNADNLHSSSSSSSLVPTRSLGHSGLPQVVSRTRRPVVKNVAKKISAVKQKESLQIGDQTSTGASLSVTGADVGDLNPAFCRQTSKESSDNIISSASEKSVTRHDSFGSRPVLTHREEVTAGNNDHSSSTDALRSYATDNRLPMASTAPISRSLLHLRPTKLTQGDGLYRAQQEAYSSGAIIKKAAEQQEKREQYQRNEELQIVADDQQQLNAHQRACTVCGASDQLYQLQPCRHLMCTVCIRKERCDVTTGVGTSDVTRIGTTDVTIGILCSVCQVTVKNKNIIRYHKTKTNDR